MSFSYIVAGIILFSTFAFFTTFFKKEDLSLPNMIFILVFMTLIGLGMANSNFEINTINYWIFVLCYPAMTTIALWKIKFEKISIQNKINET